MGNHAILSPSAASRWLVCTPSARLEAELPDTAGEAAKEGTVAHALAELLLTQWLGRPVPEGLWEEAHDPKYYSAEMEDYVATYVDYVKECYHEMAAFGPVTIFLETRVDLTGYVPDGFGTRDVVIVAGCEARMIDLKYGKGVPVSAEKNKQLMTYAIGTVDELELVYEIETIEMVIHQPRLDSISTYAMSVGELREWAENTLRPRAALAFKGEGDFVAGEHCKFCRVKNTCRAFSEFSLAATRREFKDAITLTDEEIAEILSAADAAISYLKGIQDYAFDQAVNHAKVWPGYKLVEGRSNRVIRNPDTLVQRLIEVGVDKIMLYKPPTLISLTEMEKVVGKKSFAACAEDLIDKPAGKPTLVPVSDKRPVFNGAVADFADE